MVLLSDEKKSIIGLEWKELWHIDNGVNSSVIPIPGLRPTNIIFKGDEPFSYGHYGIHLGQEDRLIFLGPQQNEIVGYFIDCRYGSDTWGNRLIMRFTSSSKKYLTIPPGVAHTFDTHGISTINLYSMLLPEPTSWLDNTVQWTVKGDIVNLKMDVPDKDIPKLKTNSHVASEVFYKLIAEEQKKDLRNLAHEYPFTQDVVLEDGRLERLKFWKRLDDRRHTKDWIGIEEIEGAGWLGNLTVWTGDVSGYVPLLDRRPKHLIDHGEDIEYSHDAFGVHLGGDDHLVFIGPKNKTARCELVDFRRGSATLHKSVIFDFVPNPQYTLVIPRGVAHRFEHMEGIYTINQPRTFLDIKSSYDSGYDVIDWPLDKRPYPIFDVNTEIAGDEYYEGVSIKQKNMLATPPTHSTPTILLHSDESGNNIKIVLRTYVK